MDMSVLLAITCDRNLVLHNIKSNVYNYNGLSTDLFTFSELPIPHPIMQELGQLFKGRKWWKPTEIQ